MILLMNNVLALLASILQKIYKETYSLFIVFVALIRRGFNDDIKN